MRSLLLPLSLIVASSSIWNGHSLSFSQLPSAGKLSGRRGVLLITCTTFLSTTLANAACLQGDTSVECIGVYKVPLDDEILPYISTPETLARFAPDVKWVPPIQYPQTYQEARAALLPIRTRCTAVSDMVVKGNLEQAGVELLDILPRLTVAGRVVISNLSSGKSKSSDAGLRALRVEAAHTEALVKLNSCDVLLGQALRGELGSLTAAQVQVLGELRQADGLLEELTQALPDDFKPAKTNKGA